MRAIEGDQLTGRLIKAARALAGMSASDLASASGLNVITIKRAEAAAGVLALRPATSDAIIQALSAKGVRFIADGPGDSETGVLVTTQFPAGEA